MPTQARSSFVDNRAKVAAALAEQVAQNRYVGELRTVSTSELEAMIDRILDDYSNWSEGDEQRLKECLDYVQNICFSLTIPLAEAAYALYVLRDGIGAVLSAEVDNDNTEANRRLNRFFEVLVRDLLRRY